MRNITTATTSRIWINFPIATTPNIPSNQRTKNIVPIVTNTYYGKYNTPVSTPEYPDLSFDITL